jgi:DNA replication protein DnaC
LTEHRPECPVCRDTGFEILETGEGSRAAPCRCRREDRRGRLLQQARIPRRYRHCTLENFDPLDPTQGQARHIAEQYVREYPAHDFGLLFLGPCGVGKTHLAVAVLQALVGTKGVEGIFYDYRDLLKEIRSTFRSNAEMTEMAVLAPIFSSQLLVLDDIGAQQWTPWVEETLSHIINHRYNDKGVTILTSNYPDRSGKEGEPTLEERIGTRLRSRLFEMCKVVQIQGVDYRINARQVDYRF